MIAADPQQAAPKKFPFETYGPFPIGSDLDLTSRLDANDFWDNIDEMHPGLRSAIGVYIFAVQPTKKSKLIPWYVGKTERGSFERRFRNHRLLFDKLLSRNGKQHLFLIARIKPGGKTFMKPRKKVPSIDILETMLIERSIDVNGNLYNESKVVHVKGLIVPGFKGKTAGKPKSSAQELKRMLYTKVSAEGALDVSFG